MWDDRLGHPGARRKGDMNLRGHCMAIDYQRYIVRDPGICGGEPIVKGTRVTVRTVLASLAEGLSVEAIIREFPTLDEAAVRAVIAFAAVSAEEDLPIPAAPSVA
jgi:uncharacterized protein (DUF433 family)